MQDNNPQGNTANPVEDKDVVPQQQLPSIPTGREKTIQPISSDLLRTSPNIAPSQPYNISKGTVQLQSPLMNSGVTQTNGTEADSGIPNDGTFITGSKLQQEKNPLPKGIYIVAAINLISFIAGFFDTSQTSAIYTFAMLLDLMLAIGLVLRISAARTIILWFNGLILALLIITFVLLIGFQHRLQQAKNNYDNTVNRLSQSTLTVAQKQELDDLQASISAKEKQVGNTIVFAYIKTGLTAVETIVITVYLTRLKVKEAFESAV